MNYSEVIERFAKKNGIELKELIYIVKSVIEVFPMIVIANLTKNTYTMIKHDDFLPGNIAASGSYDDLIDEGVDTVHPIYQQNFI